MTTSKPIVHAAAVLAIVTCVASESSLASCGATVNGRPMSAQECALSTRVYGYVLPGNYWMDNNGNWVNASNPAHRGNVYRDAQGGQSRRQSGRSLFSSNVVVDTSGGCEGGSCVNILD